LLQNILELIAQPGDGILLLLVVLQQYIGVVVDLFADMGIFDVEVVVARHDVGERHYPGLFILHTSGEAVGLVAPPADFGLEFLETHRFGFVVALDAFRVWMFVVPDMLGGFAFSEEQQIGLDAGIGREHAVGQAHDGVQVALLQQHFFQSGFHTLTEQEAIRQYHGGTAPVLQSTDDQCHEQVGRFPCSQVGREVLLDTILFHAAEGRVGDDDIDLFLGRVVGVRAAQCILVLDAGGRVNAVQDHVGGAEHVRQRFFLDAKDALLHYLFITRDLHIVAALVIDGAGQKTTRTTGGIKHALGQLGVDAVDDELGDGARGVELARIPRTLQVFKYLLVDAAKGMAIGSVIEVDLADFVDHLPQQGARLHVVIGIFKQIADHQGTRAIFAGDDQLFFQGREELQVHKIGERVAGHAFRVFGPVTPAQVLGQRRLVIIFRVFKLQFTVVVNLEEEHPHQLADTLRIAIDTHILAHDVLNGLDDSAYIAHALIPS